MTPISVTFKYYSYNNNIRQQLLQLLLLVVPLPSLPPPLMLHVAFLNWPIINSRRRTAYACIKAVCCGILCVLYGQQQPHYHCQADTTTSGICTRMAKIPKTNMAKKNNVKSKEKHCMLRPNPYNSAERGRKTFKCYLNE